MTDKCFLIIILIHCYSYKQTINFSFITPNQCLGFNSLLSIIAQIANTWKIIL